MVFLFMAKTRTLLSPMLVIMLLISISYFYSCSCNNGSRDKGAKKVDQATAGTERAIEKANYNVFMENSASMDGYVEGDTRLETSIFDLLNKVKSSEIADTIRRIVKAIIQATFFYQS